MKKLINRIFNRSINPYWLHGENVIIIPSWVKWKKDEYKNDCEAAWLDFITQHNIMILLAKDVTITAEDLCNIYKTGYMDGQLDCMKWVMKDETKR